MEHGAKHLAQRFASPSGTAVRGSPLEMLASDQGDARRVWLIPRSTPAGSNGARGAHHEYITVFKLLGENRNWCCESTHQVMQQWGYPHVHVRTVCS